MGQVGLLDCNNFFVSCERLFRPELAGKPVAVLSSNDGCIVARSQEVKDMGIPMGAPYFQVKQLCEAENVTLFSGNLTLYRDISARVMEVLQEEVGDCEVYSIDEAFFMLPEDIHADDVKRVGEVVCAKVGVPVSVGVAPSKTLAKVASGVGKKQGGFCLLTMPQWQLMSESVPVGAIWGLGRATTAQLGRLQVKTAHDFMCVQRSTLQQQFGIGTQRVYDELHGKSVFTVEGNSAVLRQSIASTRSFAKETKSLDDAQTAVAGHVVHVAEKLRQRGVFASRMHVQLGTSRHGDFFLHGGSAEVVLDVPSNQTALLLAAAMAQVHALFQAGVPYKKAGVTVSGLLPEACVTQNLFSAGTIEKGVLDTVTDGINARFGKGTLRPGVMLDNTAKSNAQRRSPNYTTVWKDIPIVRAK